MDRIGERARRQERDKGGEGADMADAADDTRPAQRTDDESQEIGGTHEADEKRAVARPLQLDADERRQEAAARHQHEDGEQQAANGKDRGQHVRLCAGRKLGSPCSQCIVPKSRNRVSATSDAQTITWSTCPGSDSRLLALGSGTPDLGTRRRLDQRFVQRAHRSVEAGALHDELHVDVADLVLHRDHLDSRFLERE